MHDFESYSKNLNMCIKNLSKDGRGIRPDIRLDIRQCNLVSGRMPDIKKDRIIRSDIRPNGYPTGRISDASPKI